MPLIFKIYTSIFKELRKIFKIFYVFSKTFITLQHYDNTAIILI